jgi:hypothetical protein
VDPERRLVGSLRRDPATLGFGLGFLALGGAGVLQAAGVALTTELSYPILLLGLGGAGLWRVRTWWLGSR